MPSYGVYFNETDAPAVEGAAKAAGQKIAPYIAEAVRRRLESEGHIPGTPAHDVREEALAAAELVGTDRVLSALKGLRAEAYAAASEKTEACA